MKTHDAEFVTPTPWRVNLQHQVYGSTTTYQMAAEWLSPCATVADWGGGFGHFQSYLPTTTAYTLVDGTQQVEGQVLADLAHYRTPSEGILLRHVLDMTEDWFSVLYNALSAFTYRMAVITFTEDALEPVENVKIKSGWPVRRFNPDTLRWLMLPHLVKDEAVKTSHPERVYLLEKPCVS